MSTHECPALEDVVDNDPIVPMPCGGQVGNLTSLFGLLSPIHRAYYSYYRLVITL